VHPNVSLGDSISVDEPHWTISIRTTRETVLLPRQILIVADGHDFSNHGDSGAMVFRMRTLVLPEDDESPSLATPVGLLHGGFETDQHRRCGMACDLLASLSFAASVAGESIAMMDQASALSCYDRGPVVVEPQSITTLECRGAIPPQ